MIIEKIPDIQKLTPEEKAILADELWAEAGYSEDDFPLSDEHIKLLEERWKHYLEHPETASTWEEVKARITRNRS